MVEPDAGHLEWVKQAQAGEGSGRATLAERVRERVYPYINRILLDADVSEDLAQDTVTAVLASLDNLREPQRFWPWVFTIATNQVRLHFRAERQRQRSRMFEIGQAYQASGLRREVLETVSREELAALTRSAMTQIGMRYRTVLALRFFEDMPHADIARVMGCSEVNVRVTFFQAKRALVRELRRRGVDKTVLVSALAAFAASTVRTEAAVAAIVVNASAVTEGLLTGMALGKAHAALLAIMVFAAATMIVPWGNRGAGGSSSTPGRPPANDLPSLIGHDTPAVDEPAALAANQPSATNDGVFFHYMTRRKSLSYTSCPAGGDYECWYWLPEGVGGPILLREEQWDLARTRPEYGWLETADATYYVCRDTNTVWILNARHCCYPHTRTLPTDTEAFSAFLLDVERDESHAMIDKRGFTFVRDPETGFVASQTDLDAGAGQPFETVYDYRPLDTTPFTFLIPPQAQVVDTRDALHQRGWAYFRVSGEMAGMTVTGAGRVPFTYAASRDHGPWLGLDLGGRLRAWDNGAQAVIEDGHGAVLKRYPGGALFKGLGRTWTGLHTLDCIRRDAATDGIRFSIKQMWSHADQPLATAGQIDVIIEYDDPGYYYQAIYTVDLGTDTLGRLEFWTVRDAPFQSAFGKLAFTYLDQLPPPENEPPRSAAHAGGSPAAVTDQASILWPLDILTALGGTPGPDHKALAAKSTSAR